MCTPELPKPMPANVAAVIMFDRASTSSAPRCTAARKDCASRPSDFSHHRSDTGLEPQYVTRSSGFFRSKVVYQRAVYDSRAWQTMSMPDAAVTSGGRLIVSSGSITASVGRSRQWLIPVFTFIDRMSSTHMAVDSEPVPAVVGIATSGLSCPGGVFAAPIGLLM